MELKIAHALCLWLYTCQPTRYLSQWGNRPNRLSLFFAPKSKLAETFRILLYCDFSQRNHSTRNGSVCISQIHLQTWSSQYRKHLYIYDHHRFLMFQGTNDSGTKCITYKLDKCIILQGLIRRSYNNCFMGLPIIRCIHNPPLDGPEPGDTMAYTKAA